MTGESATSVSTSQRPTQRSACVVGLERELRCLPVVPGTGYCAKHDPGQADVRREQASAAARRSHAARLVPLNLPSECMIPDFSTPVRRIRYREALAAARAQGKIDDKAAGILLSAVDGATRDDNASPKGKAAPAGPLVVEIQRFNGDRAS